MLYKSALGVGFQPEKNISMRSTYLHDHGVGWGGDPVVRTPKKGAHGNIGGWMEGERCAGGGVVEQMDGEG